MPSARIPPSAASAEEIATVAAPFRPAAPEGQQVRQRRAEGQGPDEEPDQGTAIAGAPADRDLHADRVDPGEAGTRKGAQRDLQQSAGLGD